METKLLLCLALIASSNAGPAWRSESNGDNECALECNSLAKNTKKFQYTPSTTYIYDYSVDTETTMAGAAEDAAKLSIQTQAEIQSIDGCEFALRLRQTRLLHSDAYTKDLKTAAREDEFRQSLESYNLRFSFDDGTIASVCPDSSETTWALNFKRGLLSAFQNSMENLEKNQKVQETDITGECEVEYNVSKSWGAWNKDVIVTKSKNLRACAERDGFKSFVQTTPYKIISDIQSLPVIRSTYKCDQTISSTKILKSAVCEETHVYVPFSNGNSGGSTKIQQKLTMATQRLTVDAGKSFVNSRRSLLFEHSFVPEQVENQMETAKQTLKEICEQTVEDIRPETPRLFTKLVTVLRPLKTSDLKDLYRLLQAKSLCPENGRTIKFFLDALPMAETEGPVEIMTTLIKNKDVEGVQAKAWMTSLAIIQNPSLSMIDAALNLLEDTFYDDAVLPVSSLVNNYCRKDISCGDKSSVAEIVKKISNKIPRRCSVTDKNAGLVMKTLRALGNAGRSGGISPALNSCLQSTYASVEVKSAAADAFRYVPCDNADQTDSQLWSILTNPAEQSELRIFSYLAVMRCHSKDSLDKISGLLDNEKDEQVGSYISSHLNNLKETSDPHKQDIAEDVRKMNFKEFSLSALKFSKNFEASFLINKLNLGLVAESDLITSPDSPLPRFAKANFSVELFGNSINLFEMGGRIEGMEALVDTLLGPYGYFFTNSKDKSKDKPIKGFAYARLFGNELFFQHFSGVEALLKSRKVPNFLDYMIQLAEKQEVAYSYSSQIMDVSLILPTISGLPLNITVNGSINFDLKAAGKADLRQVAASPRSLDIDGEFKPSAALEITGTMAIDAMVAKLGLRMRNTMHSSTGVKGRIHIDRGHKLNIEIEPPKDKMEIFNAKSQFFIVHNEVEKEQEMIKSNRKVYKWCTGNTVSNVLGVEFCGELQFPNASHVATAPYFPLSGPISVNIMSFRRDTHTSYKLFAQRSEEKHRSIGKFLVDTPGSKVKRMISTDVTLSYSHKQLDILIDSPWKKLNVNGGMVMNKDIYSLVGSVLMDDVNKYGFTTELKMSKIGSTAVYNPLVQVIYKGAMQSLVSGQVEIDADDMFSLNKLRLDLLLQAYNGAPYNAKWNVINTNKEKRLLTSLSSGNQDIFYANVGSTISGKDNKNFMISPELTIRTSQMTLISFNGMGDYKAEKSLNGNVTLNIYKQKPTTFSVSMTKGLWGKIDMKVKSTLVTGDIKVDNTIANKQKTSIIRGNYNIPSIGKDSFKIDSKYQDKSQKSFSKYSLTSKLTNQKYMDYNMDIAVNVDHKEKRSSADTTIKYGANPGDKKKVVNLSYSFKMNAFSPKETDFELQVSAQAPEKDISTNLKLDHNHNGDELNSNMALKLLPYLKNDVSASVALKNGGLKFTKLTGQTKVMFAGKRYALNTDLTQKSKNQYIHNVDVSIGPDSKYSISSSYNMKDDNAHEVTSEFNLDGYDPIKLRGNVSLGSSNYGTSVTAIYGSDEYGATILTKYIENKFGKLNMLLIHPSRQIQADGEAKISSGKYEGIASVNLDAGNKNSKQKASVEYSVSQTYKVDSQVYSGELKVKTPFSNYEEVSSKVAYTTNNKQMATNARLSWGKEKKITSTVTIARPVSLKYLKISANLDTPFNEMKALTIDVDHTVDQDLNSIIKAKLNNDKAELAIKGQNNGNKVKNDLSTSLSLKTTLPSLRDVSLVMSHTDEQNRYRTSGMLSYNADVYQSELTMTHKLNGLSVSSNGNIKITWPSDSIEATWNHNNNDVRSLKTSLTSTWGGQFVNFNLDGSNELRRDVRQVKGTIRLETPWEDFEKTNIIVEHSCSNKKLSHRVEVKKDGADYAVYEYLLETGSNAFNSKFLVKLPNIDTVHGQTTINYYSNPTTASAWLEWSPSRRVDFDASVNTPSIENMELDTKISTPFRNFENIVIKASHKLESSQYVTNFAVDYSVRKSIAFTNTFQFDDDLIVLKTAFMTPCRYFRAVNYGFRIALQEESFDGIANFEMIPYVKKHDGQLKWRFEKGGYNGHFNLNTPHSILPDVKITSWRKSQNDDSKVVHIDITSSPYGTYSYDVTYKTLAPYYLDMQVKTPHASYEYMGIILSHEPSAKAIHSKVEAVYLSRKEFAMDLNMNWNNKIEGNLLLNTPLKDYRTNKFSISHEATKQGFNCKAEASVGASNVKGDATFLNSNNLMSGSANLAVSKVKRFEGKFKVNGGLIDLKADASVKVDSKAFTTAVTNSMKPGFYKTTLNLNTPYSDDLTVEFKHEDQSNRAATKFDTTINASYGDREATSQLTVTCSGLKSGKFDISLTTPFEGFESFNANLVHEMAGDKIFGKAAIKSSIDSIENIEASINKQGPLQDMSVSVNLMKNSEDLIAATAENKWKTNEVQEKVSAKGKWLPSITLLVDHKGTYLDFNTKTRLTVNNKIVLDKEIAAKIDDSTANLSGKITYSLYSEEHTHSIIIHKEGDMSSVIKVNVITRCDGKEVKMNAELETVNRWRSLIQIENLTNDYNFIGFDIVHSGDLDKFLADIKIFLSRNDIISSRTNFFKYNNKRVEFKSELTTPFNGYRNSKIEYRHEGQSNRASCNINLNIGDNSAFSSDLIMQREPALSFSFNIKTPFSGYEQLLLSSSLEDKVFNGKALLGQGVDIQAAATLGSQYQLTTSFDSLKEISIKIEGMDLNRNWDVYTRAGGKTVSVKGELMYTSPDTMSFKTTLNSDINNMRSWQFIVKNSNDGPRKTSHIEVSWDPKQKMVVDGQYLYRAGREVQGSLDMSLPLNNYKQINIDMGHTFGNTKMNSKFSLEVNNKKMLDLDSALTNGYDKMVVVVRKPWPQEYTVSLNDDDDSRDIDISLNWNKDVASNNIQFKNTITDLTPGKKITFEVIYLTKTVGLEQSYVNSDTVLTNTGAIYWDDKDDSRITYSLNMNTNSPSTDGELKLVLPSRSLVLKGSSVQDDGVQKVDATFGWDMDRDESRTVGLTASISNKEYTKADVSVKLLSDLQVNSVVIFNHDNIIFDGRTDILFTKDTKKTLTLYSTVKNTLTKNVRLFNNNGFNYSVELGVRHPETKVDVKIDSHIGQNTGRMSSSLGFKYMTSTRQYKNLALFAEINKLKNELNFVATTPFNNIGLNGKYSNGDSFVVETSAMMNGEQSMTSSLQTSARSIKFNIGQRGNMYSFRAMKVNDSSVMIDFDQVYDNDKTPEAAFSLTLIKPRLLQSSISWKPTLLTEFKSWLSQQTAQKTKEFKDFARQLNNDIRYEVSRKQREICGYFPDTFKDIIKNVETELEALSSSMENMQQSISTFRRAYSYSQIESVMKNVEIELSKFIKYYKSAYPAAISSVMTRLDRVKQYSVDRDYKETISASVESGLKTFDDLTTAIISLLQQNIDLSFIGSISTKAQDLVKNVKSQIDGIEKRIMSIDVGDAVAKKLDFLNDYKKTALKVSRNHLNKNQFVSNEIYQQIEYFSRYLEVEENLKNHINYAVRLMKEIVTDELKEYANDVKGMIQNPVVVYKPENGRIVLHFALPSANNLPDVSDRINKVTDFIQRYTPNRDSLPKISQYLWSNKSTTVDDIQTELEEFVPRTLRIPPLADYIVDGQ